MDDVQLPSDCARSFRVVAPIAVGGYGAVFLAEHRQLGRRAAVKVLHAAQANDPELVLRFLAEARITASLVHPGIVVVHDHGADDGIPWIAYELLEGGSLTERVARGPATASEAAGIGAQVARALACAHAAGVLHRDVKPDNVLAAGPGLYKVADFGIARWSRAGEVKTATGVILGTPHYLAPEVIAGGEPGPAADLYALAVMLYELTAGERPFEGDRPLAVLERHLAGAPVPLAQRAPHLPRAFVDVVMSGLAKDPTRRPPSAMVFAEALERIAHAGAGGASGGKPAASRPPAGAASSQTQWDPLESTCRHASLSIL